jgi:hypothetical protein
MPDMRLGHEKWSYKKYQIVMILSLPRKSHRLGAALQLLL